MKRIGLGLSLMNHRLVISLNLLLWDFLTASHIKNYQVYNDAALISVWQSGDERAFDSLFERYVIYLTNIALKKTTSPDTARECVQEVFLSLYLRKNELQTISSLKAYLYTALQHKIYNHYQKELTRRQYEQAAGERQAVVGNDSIGELETKELEKQIREKIQELPPQCRKVFLMSREEQLPYKEIASQLNISVNTVEQHMQKALRIIRTSISKVGMLLF
ncbi:MAG: RNA polymerase sigma-70 factor [Chitinophagaceae bacterium]|nr:MAG: RNA polymerase sigma-70 factor [Chitinophagaceae bacterium]